MSTQSAGERCAELAKEVSRLRFVNERLKRRVKNQKIHIKGLETSRRTVEAKFLNLQARKATEALQEMLNGSHVLLSQDMIREAQGTAN